jgi:inorganic pyrophosphatase
MEFDVLIEIPRGSRNKFFTVYKALEPGKDVRDTPGPEPG